MQMKLILCYGDSLRQDFFKKYNVSEKSDEEEFCQARYNYLCEVLGNSSFFYEKDLNTPDMDGDCETFILSDSAEKESLDSAI